MIIGQAQATDYYVDANTGNDADDGLSLANAWLTLEYADGGLTDGDTLYLVDGTWDDDYPVFDMNVTITAHNGTPIINGTTVNIVTVYNSSKNLEVNISDIHIKRWGTGSNSNLFLRDVKANITNVTIISADYWNSFGIRMANADDTLIDGCTLYATAGDYFMTIIDNYPSPAANASHNVIIRNCNMEDGSTYGIDPDAGSDNWLIENNTISYGANLAVRSYSGGIDHIIRYNTFYRAAEGSSTAYRASYMVGGGLVTSGTFQNNKVYGLLDVANKFGQGVIISENTGTSADMGIILENNQYYNMRTDDGNGIIDIDYIHGSDPGTKYMHNISLDNETVYNNTGVGMHIGLGVKNVTITDSNFSNNSVADIIINVNQSGINFTDTEFSNLTVTLGNVNVSITGAGYTLQYVSNSTVIATSPFTEMLGSGSYKTHETGGTPDTKIEYWGPAWTEGTSDIYIDIGCFWYTDECANVEQTDTQPSLKITNNGTGAGTPKMKLNESTPAGIEIYVDDDNSFAGAVMLTTTYQAVGASLNQDENVTLWAWGALTGAPEWYFEVDAIVE